MLTGVVYVDTPVAVTIENEVIRPGTLAHVASPRNHVVVLFGALGVNPCAEVETLLVATSVTLKSESAGCAVAGEPFVPIALIHWCKIAVCDLTPPSVVALGFGSCTGATLPEMSENAGWVEDGAPFAPIALIHSCEMAA